MVRREDTYADLLEVALGEVGGAHLGSGLHYHLGWGEPTKITAAQLEAIEALEWVDDDGVTLG